MARYSLNGFTRTMEGAIWGNIGVASMPNVYKNVPKPNNKNAKAALLAKRVVNKMIACLEEDFTLDFDIPQAPIDTTADTLRAIKQKQKWIAKRQFRVIKSEIIAALNDLIRELEACKANPIAIQIVERWIARTSDRNLGF